MQKHLQMSHRVKLDRLGTFKIGMHTSPADTVKDFTAKTIKEAVADFQKGNMRLGLALTLVKEEMK